MPKNVMNSAGNVGCFKPWTAGHDSHVKPFFALLQGCGLPLFNDAYVFLWFSFAIRLPSFAHVMMPGI